jgi:hypothetical protein
MIFITIALILINPAGLDILCYIGLASIEHYSRIVLRLNKVYLFIYF